jgi:hypothetical protein
LFVVFWQHHKGNDPMRIALAAISCIFGAATALAQVQLPDKSAGDSPHSTGRTVSPETKGQQQPQGDTGPLNTTRGGAPAESPQGQTPPGMQSAPKGSSETIVDPNATRSQPAPNQIAKDTVPPATDKSEASRAGAQEPSAKVEGTSKDEKASFNQGTLSAPGAPKDVDTAPSKFSARTAADDALPIAAYALRHLTAEQRRAIVASVRDEKGAKTEPGATEDFAKIGALVPTAVALSGLSPLPESIAATIPDTRTVKFARAGDDKLLLINPRTRVVLEVLAR